MNISKLSKQTLKVLGATVLLSAALHITLIFYQLSFNTSHVIITEPNQLLVYTELTLAVFGTLYAGYLLVQELNQLLNQVS